MGKPIYKGQDFDQWNRAAIHGTVRDSENPAFVLSSDLPRALLQDIADGVLDVQQLARELLSRRFN